MQSRPHRLRWLSLLFLAAGCSTSKAGPSTQQASLDPRFDVGPVLFSDDFTHGTNQWVAELEDGGTVRAHDGKLEIEVPRGSSLWFKQELQGPVMIEYDATEIKANGPYDRVSDLNCFWMATDPRSPNNLLDIHRSGKLADYNELRCYYVGQGGNYNTTTRFRRYIGSATTRPILPEHDLSAAEFLLKPNVRQKIQLVACGNLIQYYRDGRKIFEMDDPEPYTRGWFALRTTVNHMIVENFRVYQLKPRPAPPKHTTVSIRDQLFCINGQPTYAGRTFRGMKVEGLLLNARMVQGIYDDENPQTRSRWSYPDGAWDRERNTRQFIAAMPEWRTHGLVAFTINLQGGSPTGYAREQPWRNSAYEEDGSLKPAYMSRLGRILDRADELGMVAILGLFYFGQEPHLRDEAALTNAADKTTDWLISKGYTNVIIEIANECNSGAYKRDIVKPQRGDELIRRVQERSKGKVKSPAGRLLVSTSMTGGRLPNDKIVESADFILLHGNGVSEPLKIGEMVEQVRAMPQYHNQPILFNEDDHFDFDKPRNNMLAAIGSYAGWGLFDYRMNGEGFDEGFQSVPTNWQISSARKRGFFDLLSKVTGSQD